MRIRTLGRNGGALFLAVAVAVAMPSSAQTEVQEPAGTSRPNPARLDPVIGEDGLRAKLSSVGMHDIADIRRADDDYTATATWFGERVALRSDARTRTIESPRVISEAQARNALRAGGWSKIEGLRRDGDSYRARAVKDGREQPLRLEARAASVRVGTAVVDPR